MKNKVLLILIGILAIVAGWVGLNWRKPEVVVRRRMVVHMPESLKDLGSGSLNQIVNERGTVSRE